MRIGIIGLGRIGFCHLRSYYELGKEGFPIQLCAFSCSSEESAERAAEQVKAQFGLSLKAYADYKKMLAEEKFDLLSICSPTPYHLENLEEAIEHVKLIICEKPLAALAQIEQTSKLLEKAKEKGSFIALNHPTKVLRSWLLKQEFFGQPYKRLEESNYLVEWSSTPSNSSMDVLEELLLHPLILLNARPIRILRREPNYAEIECERGKIVLEYVDKKEIKKAWTFYFKDFSYTFSYSWNKNELLLACSFGNTYSLGRATHYCKLEDPLKTTLRAALKGQAITTAEEGLELLLKIASLK